MKERMKNKPDFLNLRWSKSDDNLLRELVERGENGNTIARILGRTRNSIFGRKHILGLGGTIKKTPKGQADPVSYGTRISKTTGSVGNTKKSPVEEFVQEKIEEKVEVKVKTQKPVKKTKPTSTKKTEVKSEVSKPKSEVSKRKSEKSRTPQSAKLAQINRRLRRGDVKKVSEKTGFTLSYVSAVISGLCPNERVINAAYSMVRGRKTNEQMMKK